MNSNDEMPLEVQGLRELLAQAERQLRIAVKTLLHVTDGTEGCVECTYGDNVDIALHNVFVCEKALSQIDERFKS